eukprot:TRINITY_DN22401_c0_g2_i1.p1 TRINITY_DN22401_c0_g2~~TRINITY_DN22401_c0_g2_i1.p1  ORF type:complete len:295 (+),score=54.69 TRINITY_DN22401_c0_g2_i1:84-887(+)
MAHRWAQRQLGIVSDSLECLAGVDEICIKEKVRTLEAITAIMGQEIEMANKYKVYAEGGVDDLFVAWEQTNFVGRNLKQCFGDCSPWHMDIRYAQGLGSEAGFKLDRPASCTFCCFNRPEAYMYDTEGNLLGSVRDPFTCCGGLNFSVQDPEGTTVLQMDGGRCQPGFWFPLPCLDCNKIEFPIVDAETGAVKGQMTKKAPSLFHWTVAPDVDHYHLSFKDVEQPENRALLLAMTIFIDFRYFNNNRNDSGHRQTLWGGLREKLLGS